MATNLQAKDIIDVRNWAARSLPTGQTQILGVTQSKVTAAWATGCGVVVAAHPSGTCYVAVFVAVLDYWGFRANHRVKGRGNGNLQGVG